MYLSVYLRAWKQTYSVRPPQFSKFTTSKGKPFCETSSFFDPGNVKSTAILRDLLHFQSWQHRKPFCETSPFFALTTSKAKQVCETSSIFELDNIKSEAILGSFLQKWRAECWADSLVLLRLAIFPSHLSKVMRLPRKSEARSYKSAVPTQNILAKLKIWCFEMQPNATTLRKPPP